MRAEAWEEEPLVPCENVCPVGGWKADLLVNGEGKCKHE